MELGLKTFVANESVFAKPKECFVSRARFSISQKVPRANFRLTGCCPSFPDTTWCHSGETRGLLGNRRLTLHATKGIETEVEIRSQQEEYLKDLIWKIKKKQSTEEKVRS